MPFPITWHFSGAAPQFDLCILRALKQRGDHRRLLINRIGKHIEKFYPLTLEGRKDPARADDFFFTLTAVNTVLREHQRFLLYDARHRRQQPAIPGADRMIHIRVRDRLGQQIQYGQQHGADRMKGI